MSPENIESFKNNIYYIHFCLSSLTYFNQNMHAAEETAIEDFGFLELLRGEWEFNILHNETVEKLKVFRHKWIAYKQNNSYAENLTFVSIDKNWHALVNIYLMPALNALEQELAALKVEFVSYKIFHEQNIRPKDEDILESARIIHELLLRNKVIEFNYQSE